MLGDRGSLGCLLGLRAPTACLQEGDGLYRRDQRAEALRRFQSARKLAGDDLAGIAASWRLLLCALLELDAPGVQRQFDEVFAARLQSIEQNQWITADWIAAWITGRCGDTELADALEQLYPGAGASTAWFLVGERWRSEGNPADAREAYKRSARLRPPRKEPWAGAWAAERLQTLPERCPNPSALARELNDAAWIIVKSPNNGVESYRVAQRWAEASCRLDRENAESFRILGAAYYRAGACEQALGALAQACEMRNGKAGSEAPCDLALISMSLHRLSRGAEAAAALERLQLLLREEKWANDADSQGLGAEAEALILGARTATSQPRAEP